MPRRGSGGIGGNSGVVLGDETAILERETCAHFLEKARRLFVEKQLAVLEEIFNSGITRSRKDIISKSWWDLKG
jgi:hypothetical protein